ncbi:Hypothetical_protein [Hexamita inflata]|uniref:Hypothetical_protein n=1 Tax=Hexamita inflata TaxID=28002 RepID=A0ABP1GI80_9EUKA
MYVRRTSAAKATNNSGTSILAQRGYFVSIYTGIHLRRTICVSKEAMERLPLYNRRVDGMPFTAAQHFESGDFTFRNRFSRAHQEVGCGEEREAQLNESSITLNKAGIPAMPLQLQRWPPSLIVPEKQYN